MCSVCLIHGRWHKSRLLLLKALNIVGLESLVIVGVEVCGVAFASSTSATVLVTLCVIGLLLLEASLRTLVIVVLESEDKTWSEEC